MFNEHLFKSNKDNWETPRKFFDSIDNEFNFTLDPCADHNNKKCKNYYTIEDDGLSKEWFGRVYMNPPYGREIVKWVSKAKSESEKNDCVVVCLVPSRTDTRWWHQYCMNSSEIRFLTKRLTFDGANNKSTFPAALIVFRKGSNNPIVKSQIVE